MVILDYFNARICNEINAGIKHQVNEETFNENEDMLIDFGAQNERGINTTFYPHKPQHKRTFQNTRNNTSIIDYVVTNI